MSLSTVIKTATVLAWAAAGFAVGAHGDYDGDALTALSVFCGTLCSGIFALAGTAVYDAVSEARRCGRYTDNRRHVRP